MKKNTDTLGFAAIVALLLLTSIFSINLFFREKSSSDKLNIAAFPCKIGEWQGKELTVTEKEYRMLETRNLIVREYSKSSDEKLFLFIIYSETNRSVFHPPEVCLIGEGVTIVDRKTEKIGAGKYSFLANRLDLEKDKSKEMVLYCYKAGKFYTDNYYYQQAYLALHQIFGKRVAGATIRVSMSTRKDEAQALSVLKNFIKETVGILNQISS